MTDEQPTEQLSEYGEAIVLANRILDRPNTDPDDELATLARQFLRVSESRDKAIRQRQEAVAELQRVASAVRTHRDMAWDDRCLEDDRRLYEALGEPIPDFALPPVDDMLESCRRYIAQRGCPVAELPPDKMTIRQLEDEVARLRKLCVDPPTPTHH